VCNERTSVLCIEVRSSHELCLGEVRELAPVTSCALVRMTSPV
jgi:hypothetical protein